MKLHRRTVLKQGVGLLAASVGAVHVFPSSAQAALPLQDYLEHDALGLADRVRAT